MCVDAGGVDVGNVLTVRMLVGVSCDQGLIAVEGGLREAEAVAGHGV